MSAAVSEKHKTSLRNGSSNSYVELGSFSTKRKEGNAEVDNISLESDESSFLIKPKHLIFQPESIRRKWLRKHGKGKMIDFEDD